ncbi:MAG: sulfurtransferase TusA family protein [Bacillota bacterium]
MAEHLIDALGEMCPIPNMMLREKLKEVAVGDIVILETDHFCAKQILETEMRRMGHRVTAKQVMPGVWQVAVRKVR